jgi:hypothetical protein
MTRKTLLGLTTLEDRDLAAAQVLGPFTTPPIIVRANESSLLANLSSESSSTNTVNIVPIGVPRNPL